MSESRSNMANSNLWVSFTRTKLSYEPNKSIQTKNMNSDSLFVSGFSSLFSLEYRIDETYRKLLE